VLVSGALLAARHAQIDGMITAASRLSVPTARRPASVPFWRMAGLGLIAFCSLLCEGATADWSSVYLHDSLHGSLGTSASAYAVFALAMTGGRLTADKIVARFGPATVLRASGLLATGGFAAGAVTGAPLAAVAGFGLLGAGLSCVVPQVYSAAGHLDAAHTGGVLSKVAAVGYSGFVIGPVLIGALAAQAGLATAMLLLPMLTLVVVAGGGLVRPRETWAKFTAASARSNPT
jgi:fucose permease